MRVISPRISQVFVMPFIGWPLPQAFKALKRKQIDRQDLILRASARQVV
jgi:hypothetical protein